MVEPLDPLSRLLSLSLPGERELSRTPLAHAAPSPPPSRAVHVGPGGREVRNGEKSRRLTLSRREFASGGRSRPLVLAPPSASAPAPSHPHPSSPLSHLIASLRPVPRARAATPARRRLPTPSAAPPQRAGGGSASDAGPSKSAPAAVATSAAEGAVTEAAPTLPSTDRGREAEARATQRTIEWQAAWPKGAPRPPALPAAALEDAYTSCGAITADYAKTFYLVRENGGRMERRARERGGGEQAFPGHIAPRSRPHPQPALHLSFSASFTGHQAHDARQGPRHLGHLRLVPAH